jgi:tetratricopeptide (TPR) repeat protein
MAAFICSANQGTLMEEEKPGLFVAELIKEMRSPGSTVEDVFKRTRMDVLRGSNSKQAPWYSSTGRGIHFFRACRETHGDAGENRPRAARGQASGFASAGPDKAGIDARRQNRNPGAPATAPKPVTPANPDAARDESIRQLDARIRANPNDVAAIYTRGQIYAKNRNFSRAIKDFDEVLRLDPKCRGAQQSLLGARHHRRSLRH